MNRGLIEARLGDLDASTTSFTKALEHDEGNPVAHFLLGLAHTVLRKYAHAQAQFEHCLGCLSSKEHNNHKYMGSFHLDAPMVQENIDHMRSKLIATAAGHGRTNHLRTCLHIVPAGVLFEPPSRSARTSQRESKSSTEHRLDLEGHEYSDERPRGPVSRAVQPLHVAGHEVRSLHLVEDAEKNLTIAPTSNTVNDVRMPRRLSPRDPRVQDGSMQELAQFLRHAGPSGDSNVTVDRKYMQRLLQGNRYNRTPLLSHGQVSEPRDEFDSLLGLYTGLSSMGRRSIPTSIDSAVSDALTVRRDNGPEHTIADVDERASASRQPTLETSRRWLHEEVQSPGPYNLIACDQHSASPAAARTHSRDTVSNDGRYGQSSSLPSVVSSMEMFTIGRQREDLH